MPPVLSLPLSMSCDDCDGCVTIGDDDALLFVALSLPMPVSWLVTDTCFRNHDIMKSPMCVWVFLLNFNRLLHSDQQVMDKFDVEDMDIYYSMPQRMLVDCKFLIDGASRGSNNQWHLIVDRLAESFKKHAGLDLLKDKHVLQCLTESAIKSKIELLTFIETNISLSFISMISDGPKHIHTTLTRAKF
nr:stromal 70 kDa heat shock-related protein, chloroplastic-like [Tanacetum cinerariifolium]